MSPVVLDHPLARHLIAELRDKDKEPERFRNLCDRLTTLLVIEASRGLPLRDSLVSTPLEETSGHQLDGSLAVVPILRAGLGMLESVVTLFPNVRVGYIGLERNEGTAIANSYYSKLPNLVDCHVFCLDPMLATGGSASQALSLIKASGGLNLTMISVVAAPEGVERLQRDHPDVAIVTAAVDRGLDDRKYILPGLGDFGDRLYGTF
jgi:uracil phosphoribosyltransferase